MSEKSQSKNVQSSYTNFNFGYVQLDLAIKRNDKMWYSKCEIYDNIVDHFVQNLQEKSCYL